MAVHHAFLAAPASAGNGGVFADIAGRHRDIVVRSQSGLPLRLSDAAGTADGADANGFAKRAMDFVLALIGLVALLPLFAIVALIIKLTSPGPVLFRQQREGRNGRLFGLYKFRSMRSDLGDSSGIVQTVDDDPRVTAFGHFLRRSSIDELPQLLNVLAGDMSLIGPRPHVPGMLAAGRPYRDIVPYYDRRRAVRPGLTGWAQANGLRGPTADAGLAIARINHDIAYIQNWSLALDCKILVMTLWREMRAGSGM